MSDRHLTDARITEALRSHLPAAAPAQTRRMVLGAAEITAQWQPRLPVISWLSAPPIERRSRLVVLIVLLLTALLVGLAGAWAWRFSEPRRIENGWIAYSTDRPQQGLTDQTFGSDVFVVRAGGPPTLIAGRNGGVTRNACPSFSPDGTKLAYGVGSTSGRWIVVRTANADGVGDVITRFTVPGSGPPVCARWSADGTRLAYLDGPVEVVRGLDGSSSAPTTGDPGKASFPTAPEIRSPSGDRTIQIICGELTVTRSNGTDTRFLLAACPSSFAGWSPDGTTILLLEDVGVSDREFAIHAFDVDGGVESVVVSAVMADGIRSVPDWRDVSWQPILP